MENASMYLPKIGKIWQVLACLKFAGNWPLLEINQNGAAQNFQPNL
jgi:hypothetical protein